MSPNVTWSHTGDDPAPSGRLDWMTSIGPFQPSPLWSQCWRSITSGFVIPPFSINCFPGSVLCLVCTSLVSTRYWYFQHTTGGAFYQHQCWPFLLQINSLLVCLVHVKIYKGSTDIWTPNNSNKFPLSLRPLSLEWWKWEEDAGGFQHIKTGVVLVGHTVPRNRDVSRGNAVHMESMLHPEPPRLC